MKKIITYLLMFTLMMTALPVYAVTDPSVLKEPVQNVYLARSGAEGIIENLKFSDVSPSSWSIEPITRFGALQIIKGYNENNAKKYRPTAPISNEESLAVLLRILGMEEAAQKAGNQLLQENSELPDHVLTLWTKGYLQLAKNMGLITEDDLDNALVEEQWELDPSESFIRRGPVTREQLAVWLVKAINSKQPDLISPLYKQKDVFNYSDWEKIDREFIPYVEAVIQKKIMVGSNNKFNPKGIVTREQMAQTLKNLDDIAYNTMNITKENGTVAYIEDSNSMGASDSIATRRILITDENGKVNEINYEYKRKSNDQILTKDVPVLINGVVGGLLNLREGEYIEYLVNNDTKEMLYASSKGINEPYELEGVLQPLNEIDNGRITITSDRGINYTFQMKSAVYNNVDGTIKINDINVKIPNAPISSKVKLYIDNNIVTKIELAGDKVIFDTLSGIVKENNPTFNYITIMTWDGKEVTKYYQKKNVQVEKQQYYDTEDEIGYIDEMFPDFRFDPRDTTIEDVEAGDLVDLKISPDGKNVLSISAKTNYIVKYGSINQIVNNGANGLRLWVKFDDLSSTIYDIDSNIPVKRAGQNISQYQLQEGQVVKLLINQAVFEPGTITESVKEIQVDEYGNTVANIYKGKLGSLNNSQRTLTLLNSYGLTKAGWRDYTKSKILDISSKNIEYYLDSKQISLDYALNYLKSPDIDVYVAMEKYYDDEKVLKVTFGTGRENILASDNVTYSNGNNKFKVLQSPNYINTHDGTIVVKNGKLLEDNNIVSPDYAQVILNGNGKAVIVNITKEPSNEATSIFRGRIKSINENEDMQVQSFALLKGMKWIYSPIPRMFTTDYETVIMDANGIIPQTDFLDYSEKTKVDKVYTIISDGTKAKYIIENPYCLDGVKGEIYETESGAISIKDTIVYNKTNNSWKDLSYSNSYAKINLKTNTIIIKNNEVISPDMLEKGDIIRVITDEYLITKLATKGARDVDGYIILVEK
ncbi:S-layer homology domain-containing protein [Vallitalea guaymasensis]|uniref:S-layer homology domain-containing protein n=1 Tax=Vallitalea guaymasensis TaxID=1185412 RepID=UPI000DE23A0E|nr:S-layer homology domain-containing protein [Vallitalea guaymasensis]